MTAAQLIARLRAIFAADPWLIPAVRWQRSALLAQHRRWKEAGVTPRIGSGSLSLSNQFGALTDGNQAARLGLRGCLRRLALL